jgi:hypothetical protein
MLEKLITNLKKNLPAPLKKMLGGEKAEEESSESTTEDVETDNAVSGDDAKKKKTTMIIRVVVILALGYFAVDEFLLKEEVPEVTVDAATEAKLAAKRKARKKKLEEAKLQAEAEAKAKSEAEAKTNAVATTEVESTDTPTTESQDGLPPVENINVTPKAEEIVNSEIVKTEPLDEKLDKLNQEISPSVEPSVEEIKVPSIGEETPKKADEIAETAENKMTSKIVDEIVETPPPNYEQTGRGLVYNCKDKFWACVDKPAYIACNKNMKFNQQNGKTIECSTVAIYANDEDCNKIQKYNVSINQSTIFCGN